MNDETPKAAEAAVVRDLTNAVRTSIAAEVFTHLVVPPGYKAVDMIQYTHRPRRIAHLAEFSELESWARYAREFRDGRTRFYRKGHEDAELWAVFDDHTLDAPAWRGHVAIHAPVATSEWREWSAIFGNWIGQRTLVDHLEDNHADISSEVPDSPDNGPSGADMLLVAREFKAHTQADFQSEVDIRTGSFGFTYDETVRGTTKRGLVEVPEAFAIILRMWEGRPPVHVKVRLRFKINDGKLSFALVPYRLDRIKQQAWREVIAEAQALLGDDAVFLR